MQLFGAEHQAVKLNDLHPVVGVEAYGKKSRYLEPQSRQIGKRIQRKSSMRRHRSD